MVKNRKTTVITLFIIVAIVWGGVLFRVGELGADRHIPVKTVSIAPKIERIFKPERMPLSETFRDPFSGIAVKKRDSVGYPQKKKREEVLVWPAVVYRGCIVNERNQRLGIVEWEGGSCFIREKEIKGAIRIKTIKNEYIELEQHRQTHRIFITDTNP